MRLLVVALCVAAIAGCGGETIDCDRVDTGGGLTIAGEFRPTLAVDDLGPLPPVAGQIAADPGACGEPDDAMVDVLRGVPPEIAVARDRETLSPAEGFLFVLPDHPLHEWRYRDDPQRDLRDGRSCRRRPPLTATLTGVDGWSGLIVVDERAVRVDAATAVEAPEVAGLPRLREGQRVRIASVRCGRRVVATRITATA